MPLVIVNDIVDGCKLKFLELTNTNKNVTFKYMP